MASPPFVISDTIPGDTDVVSQFPGVDRTLRDVVSSWLSYDHNNNPGGHAKLTMDQISDPTPISGKTIISSRTDGSLVKQVGTNPVEYVGTFPGAVMWGAQSAVPNGWLAANGQAVSRSTYANLFALLGATYGTGDGSTTFNVPNLVDRTPITSGNLYALGATGGEATHTLLTAEMPSHTHIDSGHTHPLAGTVGYLNPQGATAFGLTGSGQVTGTGTANIQNTGGGGAHNNLQPYIGLNAFIKY
jgi:microcystin-dependent protein